MYTYAINNEPATKSCDRSTRSNVKSANEPAKEETDRGGTKKFRQIAKQDTDICTPFNDDSKEQFAHKGQTHNNKKTDEKGANTQVPFPRQELLRMLMVMFGKQGRLQTAAVGGQTARTERDGEGRATLQHHVEGEEGQG